MPKSDKKIQLYLQMDGEGDKIIEVPANWKITFGYVNPAKSKDAYRSNEGHCLRLYDGTKLRAAIGNVTGFRDLSIPVARKVEREVGASSWENDSDGNVDSHTTRTIESEVVDESEENPF